MSVGREPLIVGEAAECEQGKKRRDYPGKPLLFNVRVSALPLFHYSLPGDCTHWPMTAALLAPAIVS